MFKKILAFIAAMTVFAAFAAVDVNKATEAELDSVKGIGPVTSKLIMSERKKGDFKSWDDFVERVKGVGDKNAAKFSAEGLTVGGAGYKGAAAAAPAAAKAKADAKADAKPMPAKDAAAVAPKDAAKPATMTTKDAANDASKDGKAAAKSEKADKKADAKAAKEAKPDAKADAKADMAKPAASAAKK